MHKKALLVALVAYVFFLRTEQLHAESELETWCGYEGTWYADTNTCSIGISSAYVYEDEWLTILSGETLVSDGWIYVMGVIENYGTIHNYGELENYYIIFNRGTIDSSIIIQNYGAIVNSGEIGRPDIWIENYGVIYNMGVIACPINNNGDGIVYEMHHRLRLPLIMSSG